MLVYRKRRTVVIGIVFVLLLYVVVGLFIEGRRSAPITNNTQSNYSASMDKLAKLKVNDERSQDIYSRDYFGGGWTTINGCDMRNLILYRDLIGATIDENCNVITGILIDPYSGQKIDFARGKTSKEVEIDHVVALSNAWATGAQSMSYEERLNFANDPLELLAVSATTNQDKSDSDASEWLPPNKSYRCEYIARQIDVKYKYSLWVTTSEYAAMSENLERCTEKIQ